MKGMQSVLLNSRLQRDRSPPGHVVSCVAVKFYGKTVHCNVDRINENYFFHDLHDWCLLLVPWPPQKAWKIFQRLGHTVSYMLMEDYLISKFMMKMISRKRHIWTQLYRHALWQMCCKEQWRQSARARHPLMHGQYNLKASYEAS